jgi:hypothetical protein
MSHWTTTQQAAVSAALTCRKHASASEIVSSTRSGKQPADLFLDLSLSLSLADGECYQPISTFAYALPTGLHAPHS